MIAIYAAIEDQTISLYLDGVFTARTDDSLTVVKDQHELQAIHLEDPTAEVEAYFMSSSSNGIRTDGTSWRCSKEYHEGWFLLNFSDTSWSRPEVDDGVSTFFMAPDAKWIGYPDNIRIFCRRKTTVGERILVHAIHQDLGQWGSKKANGGPAGSGSKKENKQERAWNRLQDSLNSTSLLCY